MDNESIFLQRKLKPVKLYLVDLQWIEHQLTNLTIQGQIFFNINQEQNSKQLIRMVKRKLDQEEIQKVDTLKIDYGKYIVHFDKNRTIVRFDNLGEMSKDNFFGVIEYLKPKQRLFSFQKQSINFTEKPKENFLTQEKVPLWLTLLLFIIGLLFDDGFNLLKELLGKIP